MKGGGRAEKGGHRVRRPCSREYRTLGRALLARRHRLPSCWQIVSCAGTDQSSTRADMFGGRLAISGLLTKLPPCRKAQTLIGRRAGERIKGIQTGIGLMWNMCRLCCHLPCSSGSVVAVSIPATRESFTLSSAHKRGYRLGTE